MIVQDRKNNIAIDLLAQECLTRDCYSPRVAIDQNKLIYVCNHRLDIGCPSEYYKNKEKK